MDKLNGLKREYGGFVVFCIVVGFIVGTGVFWRGGRVLYEVSGRLYMGVLAWVLGGVIISGCVMMFATMAARYERLHGMVDYAEELVSARYGFLCGWFFAVMYQAAGYAIIAWISASFTAALMGHHDVIGSWFVFLLAGFYMLFMAVFNYMMNKWPMRFNVITTVLRLIPLVVMGIFGIGLFIAGTRLDYVDMGVVSGYMGEGVAPPSFMGAIFATVFAYNGWQAAVAFNSEVVNGKKRLPRALIFGFLFVVVIYVMYFVGVVLSGDAYGLMVNNQLGTRLAFSNAFGHGAGDWLMAFVIMSGLGILNACCMGMSRSLYAVARRGGGRGAKWLSSLRRSMVVCVIVSFLWLMVIYGNWHGWFGEVMGYRFRFELPDFYNMMFFVLIMPIFVGFIRRHRGDMELSLFRRAILPVMAVMGAGFMVFAQFMASLTHAVVYALAFVVLGVIGFVLKHVDREDI